jgi:hypothetical protein
MMLTNEGGKLVAASNLVAASVSRFVAARVILANLIATSVTGHQNAVRLPNNAANLVTASVGEDFIRHSKLTKQVKDDHSAY